MDFKIIRILEIKIVSDNNRRAAIAKPASLVKLDNWQILVSVSREGVEEERDPKPNIRVINGAKIISLLIIRKLIERPMR